MISSKSIDDLRPDVAANFQIFVKLMAEKGFKVAVANTYRDDEYQEKLYAQGRTAPGRIVTYSRVTTFHGKRLAVDIYQDAPTFAKQWQDTGFWKAARELMTTIGFSPISGEESHSEWSAGKKVTGGQVRAGAAVPPMPLYEPPQALPASVLRIGSKGNDVKRLQTRLNELAFPCGAVDGDFGRRTAEAVNAFQAASGLTVDGVVGPKTWAALYA
jgi:peptidoglycan L-alanyl-D-glutamate endopeptidase CwlK